MAVAGATGIITSAELADNAVTTDKLIDDAVTNPKILDETIAEDKLANPGRRNLIINGDMRIAQRGTSADGTSAYLLDRFKKQVGGTPANGTISQDTDTPDGFQNSQKATFSGSATFFQTGQQIEFNNFSHLLGESVTVSVYYKSDVDITLRIRHNTTTTDGTCLFGGAGSSELSDKTLSASASWTRATHTFTINASSVAISVEFGTGALVSGDDIWITGVQLEAGSTASDFEHLNITEQIQLCERYFNKSYALSVAPGTANTIEGSIAIRNGNFTDNNSPFWHVSFPTRMRTEPTVTTFDYAGNSGKINGPSNASVTGTAYQIDERGFNILNSSGSSVAKGDYYCNYKASAEL